MPAPRPALAAVQLRLHLAPACEWHAHPGGGAPGADACDRDAQVCVTDPVRGLRALCCAAHGLRLADAWRQTVPNRRRNVTRVRVAWLPNVPRYLTPPPAVARVVGAVPRRPPRRRAA